MDLYRRGALVLERKKLKIGAHTKGFDDAMIRAHAQSSDARTTQCTLAVEIGTGGDIDELLAASPGPITLEQIAARFTARGPWKKRLPHLLDMLVAVGRVQPRGDGYG